MNDITLAGTLVTSPSAAFAELRERPRFWFPLLLLALGSAALVAWYYGMVDVPWLVDRMMSTDPRLASLPPESRERLAAGFTRNGMLISSVVGVFVFLPVICALQSTYYLLAGKVAGVGLSFKHWFAMVAWSGLPAFITILAGAAILLTEGSPMQMPPTQLQVLSFNELFFHIPESGKGAMLLGSLTLVTPWSWALLALCVRTWTNRSWTWSATFALLPSVLWYAGWAFIAFK